MINRTTHAHSGGLAVFLIGARVNKPWRPDAWVPAFAAMRPMVDELYADPSSGFLGARFGFEPRGALVVQYWRSVDDVYRYANDPGHAHRPAWIEFYRRAKKAPGAVGIWHETFAVEPGGHESVYGDMPVVGLAAATGSVPASSRGRTARERITNASPRTPPRTPLPR